MIKEIKDDFDLNRIATSGQCFRFLTLGDGVYVSISGGKLLKIKSIGKTTFDFSCDEAEFDSYWRTYYDLDTNYSKIRKMVKDDPFLSECTDVGKGIRILTQDKWEMIVSFIISQRKSIPAIQTSIERLCKLSGKEIEEGFYSFPSPGEILLNADSLSTCGLGYRQDYILKAAELFYENPNLLNELEALDDDTLFEQLKTMQGVGDKVASCIALFGFHRLNFFPKDVWIYRALDEHYPNGFDFEKYKPYNGVMQQYIFYAYRGSH